MNHNRADNKMYSSEQQVVTKGKPNVVAPRFKRNNGGNYNISLVNN